jgi:hypothetical protein
LQPSSYREHSPLGRSASASHSRPRRLALPRVAHATMDHTWHGKITKINAKMGTTSSFSFKKGTETYVVHWDAMTHFVMGTAKNIKVGALVTVTGTVKGMIITGTKLDV